MSTKRINQIAEKTALILTGTVYDLATSGLGSNVEVSVCKKISGSAETEYDVLTSSVTDSDGNYYMVINENILSIPAGTTVELVFTASVNGNQLPLNEVPLLKVTELNGQILTDLKIYSDKLVKGIVSRKNKKPAAYIKVELYNETDGDGADTFIGSAITDIEGRYSIPFNASSSQVSESNKPLRLYLKYYNNECINYALTKNEASIVDYQKNGHIGTVTYSDANGFNTNTNTGYPKTRSNKSYDSMKGVYDLIVEKELVNGQPTGYTYYYLVTQVSEVVSGSGKTWNTNQKLIYVRIELPDDRSEFWRIINTGSSNASAVLEKQVEYTPTDRTRRTVYTKAVLTEGDEPLPYKKSNIAGKVILRSDVLMPEGAVTENSISESLNKYYLEYEYFKVSRSPVIVTSANQKTINFQFTDETDDLYTRLKNLKTEAYAKVKDELFTK